VSRGAAFFASLLVTLGKPAWWLLALAGFLARGGLLLAVLPIVSLPSPLVLSNLVSPVVVPLALGRLDPVVVLAVGFLVVALLGWLVVGGLVGAATDLALIREATDAAADEGVGGTAGGARATPESPPRDERGLIARVLAVRLLCHVPFAVLLVIGSVGIANIAYGELTRPAEVATPLVVRILVAAARPIAALVVAWLLGELAGGVAARRVVLLGEAVRAAVGGAIAMVVRRPLSFLLPGLVMTLPLLLILGGTLGGARIAWLAVDDALADPSLDGGAAGLSLVTFVAIWLAALALIGLVAAARSAAMTFETVRAGAARESSAAANGRSGDAGGGTFGASVHHRSGDWPVGHDGGSL
jgi:hypothetical protein